MAKTKKTEKTEGNPLTPIRNCGVYGTVTNCEARALWLECRNKHPRTCAQQYILLTCAMWAAWGSNLTFLIIKHVVQVQLIHRKKNICAHHSCCVEIDGEEKEENTLLRASLFFWTTMGRSTRDFDPSAQSCFGAYRKTCAMIVSPPRLSRQCPGRNWLVEVLCDQLALGVLIFQAR